MSKLIETEICNFFKENSDENFKKFHSNLCPNTSNIIGIRVPILKGFSKKLLKEYLHDYNEIKEFLNNSSEKYYENMMLKALIIAYSKLSLDKKEKLLDVFIPKIDNWCVCDILCSNLKLNNKDKKEFFEYINKYSRSEKEFEIRFYIVMLISNYIEKEYIYKNFNTIEKVKNEEYYVKMAIAWYISISYIKYKNETLEYLRNCKLDKFTYNKALQKIIESSRVDKEDKEYIRSMKIK